MHLNIDEHNPLNLPFLPLVLIRRKILHLVRIINSPIGQITVKHPIDIPRIRILVILTIDIPHHHAQTNHDDHILLISRTINLSTVEISTLNPNRRQQLT